MRPQNQNQSFGIKALGYKDLKEVSMFDNVSVDEPPLVQKKSFFERLKYFFLKVNILLFFVELFGYLGTRIRIIFVILTVFTEFFGLQINAVKKFLVQNLFWGRGGRFRYIIQAASLLLVVIVGLSYIYRNPIAEKQVVRQVYGVSTDINSSDLLVQNSSTVTQVPADRGRLTTETYIVKAGDTLSTIAEQFHLTVETLMWANNLTSSQVNDLNPGDKVVIPPGNGVLVKIGDGDTVDSLAEKYNTNSQLIIEWNLMDFPFALNPGDMVFVPEGRVPEPPKPVIAAAPSYSGVIGSPANIGGGSGNVDPSVGRFLNWPVAGGAGSITQCFWGGHNGMDIASNAYPDIVSAASGVVTFAGCQSGNCPPMGQAGGSGFAWTVVVDHGNGYRSVYAHLNNIYVASGQQVSAGSSLGQMGNSGYATGVHLHFSLLSGGGWNFANPAAYMTNSVCGY